MYITLVHSGRMCMPTSIAEVCLGCVSGCQSSPQPTCLNVGRHISCACTCPSSKGHTHLLFRAQLRCGDTDSCPPAGAPTTTTHVRVSVCCRRCCVSCQLSPSLGGWLADFSSHTTRNRVCARIIYSVYSVHYCPQRPAPCLVQPRGPTG